MEKGQLGTEIQKRFIFIWEGTVAHLPDRPMVRNLEWSKRRLHLWDQAVGYWVLHDIAIKWMWTLLVRTDIRTDVCVTSRSDDFAQAVARRLERDGLPVRYVFADSPNSLGRRLPVMPDVDRVYFGLEHQRWAYGHKGVLLNEAHPHQVI